MEALIKSKLIKDSKFDESDESAKEKIIPIADKTPSRRLNKRKKKRRQTSSSDDDHKDEDYCVKKTHRTPLAPKILKPVKVKTPCVIPFRLDRD